LTYKFCKIPSLRFCVVNGNVDMSRVNWSEDETKVFLNILLEKNVLHILDGKCQKNLKVFKEIEIEMKNRGFIRDALKIRIKWKKLKTF